jgi:hypothetical protein
MRKQMKHFVYGLIGATLLAAGAVTQSHAQSNGNKWVWITNHSSSSVWNLYYSNPQDPDWGYDRLGDRTIPGGRERRVNVSDYANSCIMDIRAVMRNGDEHVRRGVNVCRTYRWTLYDGWNNVQYVN